MFYSRPFVHLFLISLSLAAFCNAQPRSLDQRDFSFNGNTLGMTLRQFRSNSSNAASLWVKNGVQGEAIELDAPLCTDQYEQIQTVPTPQAGEVICVTTAPLVASHRASRALYRFYREHLYEMVIGHFSQTERADVLDAFQQKLGKAQRMTLGESASDVWTQGKKTITLRENSAGGPLLVFLDESISPASFQSAEARTPGIQSLQYRGFRLGMSIDDALKLLRAIEQKDYDECSLEREAEACDADRHIPDCSESECDDRGGLTIYLNARRVWGIQQNLGGEDVRSYVLAFARKYGVAQVERHTYRNGLGNEFHGNVWVWERGRESLQVFEVCAGETLDKRQDFSDMGCLVLYSGVLAPPQALPTI
jgi:hypothetical protein